jgi:hypothetical protein
MIPKNRRDDGRDNDNDDSGDIRADSDFLAYDDRAIRDFRESEKESKKMIVKHMVKLRHNLQYNKHLLSVYLKAKAIFDEMVDEHRTQIHHLDEIYKHLSKLINEQLTKKNKPSKKLRRGDRDRDRDQSDIDHDKPMLKELVKDKKNIGKLLSNMRKGLDKLMEIDTIIGTTIDKINEIQFIEDDDEKDEKDEGDEGDIEDDEDSASEEEYEDEDSASEEEYEDEDSASEQEDDEEAEEEEEADEEEADEDSASEDEDSASEDEEEADEEDSTSEDDAEEEDSASEEEDSASDDREPIVFY